MLSLSFFWISLFLFFPAAYFTESFLRFFWILHSLTLWHEIRNNEIMAVVRGLMYVICSWQKGMVLSLKACLHDYFFYNYHLKSHIPMTLYSAKEIVYLSYLIFLSVGMNAYIYVFFFTNKKCRYIYQVCSWWYLIFININIILLIFILHPKSCAFFPTKE